MIPPALATEPPWAVYELLFKHYENDMALYWTRANFFLLIETGLVAFVAQAQARTAELQWRQGILVASLLGLLISLIWLAVLATTLMWMENWRNELIRIDAILNPFQSVARSFEKARWNTRRRRLVWYARPSRVALAMPVCFMLAWAYMAVGF
jgi:hypothetical protein